MIKSKSGVFETQSFQDCPTEPIIQVKRKIRYSSYFPKLSLSEITSFNNNIIGNFSFGSQSLTKSQEDKNEDKKNF